MMPPERVPQDLNQLLTATTTAMCIILGALGLVLMLQGLFTGNVKVARFRITVGVASIALAALVIFLLPLVMKL